MAHESQFSNYGVGKLLFFYSIEYCIHNKIELFDFLRGNEKYKYSFGAKDTKNYKVYLGNKSIKTSFLRKIDNLFKLI